MFDRGQRYRGCLLGLAAGDAVGTTLEFREPGSFEPLTDMVGGGPFNLQAGQWTDDTSMALCLAHSLLHCQGFDPADQMQRYCAWRKEGYMSSNGRCFDIGVTVSEALSQFLSTGDPFSGSSNPFSAGNGSLMRLAPVVMYFSPNLQQVIHYCGESSRTTHAALECIDACRYFGSLLHLALTGTEKSRLLNSTEYTPETRKVSAVSRGEYQTKTPAQIKGSGYVVDCLEAALWCFYRTDNFRDAILMAANLGDDADTTAAVCGQIAGAFYGVEGIPAPWRNQLTMAAEIAQLSDRLAAASSRN
ncbi:ADP-ribosylglycohydrolase family protein [Ketobacter sp.]|uniref:ADP-ribosylglycohydrolase family protein n=1 Tax=Ketobacter sp. TaxID=2083498 RepID=UPI000F151839|nr:ADP-ribosylglycohydrolase family protein [Ketobacter sp.]RLU01839.1 MAG: ADP-ribosylglycohydrolase family protein [Ketobacter sp.]